MGRTSVAGDDTEIVRVLFQILKHGDRRKMDAISNVSQTGGGARDLRFRPASKFLPFFRRMLPDVVLERRGTSEIETYCGPVVWEGAGGERSEVMTVWPATDARPDECRIARINRFDFSGLVKEDPNGGESIIMLFQQQSGVVRVYFTTETSLKSENWNPTIKNFAKEWLAKATTGDQSRRQFKSAFLDLETNERFPHD